MLCNVVTFGAIGDGIHDDTAAIQSAINTCCEHGGGKVTLPGGKIFRCGALQLGSNMEFHLETGAVLKGADNLDAYRLFGKNTSPKKRSTPSYVNCEYAGAPTHFSSTQKIAKICPSPAAALSTATKRFSMEK